MVLYCDRITKQISGKIILDEVSLELSSGHVYGFVGPNGCGKTMLFRALSGLMSVNSGEIRLDNSVLHKDFSVLPSLGIVLENVGMYPELTGFQNLEYLAGFKGIIGADEIREVLFRVGLDPADKRTYKKYSLGMKQRLAVAQAVMERPAVIMLDEPTNALDQAGIGMIRKVILQEKERGAIILLASHSAEDIQMLADVVFEMEEGKIVRSRRLCDD